MPTKLTAAVLVVVSALALAACGNPKKKDQAATGPNATPTQALQEIDYVRKDLLRVTNEVSTGNRKSAVEIAKETYVQHFEKIEPVLEKISPKLKDSLEMQFSGTLRKKLRSNAPKKEIFAFINGLDARIGQAQVQIKNLH